jgi:tripartite-type tricarboxylate transporter receptor subunit TctC
MKTFLFLLLLLFSQISFAKTVTVIIPFSAGGPTDQLWRTIKPVLNENLSRHGIKLITENLPGAGGTIAANKISETTNRLVLGFFSPALAIAPALTSGVVRYDLDAIKLVGYAGSTDMIVVSSLSREEFKKKCKDSQIFFGSSGNGSTSHLLGTVVAKEMQCQESIHVPYKGIASAYADLLSRRIDYIVDFSINASEQISSGKIKKVFSMSEKFTNNLENWHVLISNKVDQETFNIIQQEFNNLKNNKDFVNDLENRLKIRNFSKTNNQQWLIKEFDVYRRFIESIK